MKLFRKFVFFGLTCAALLGASGPAHATVLVPLDTEALTTQADRVLLGVVESLTGKWTSDHQAIYTDVTLVITRSYKGGLSPGARITVRKEGGQVGDFGMRVSGAAEFAVGEEVVLFLEARGGATYTVGMTQGKLRVERGADGQKMVRPDLSGVVFTRGVSASELGRPRRLVDLEQQIRSYLGGAK